MRQEQPENDSTTKPQSSLSCIKLPERKKFIRNHPPKVKQLQTTFNLLDFIIDKQKEQKPSKKSITNLPKKQHKQSFRSPLKNKSCSQLRRTILLNKDVKSSIQQEEVKNSEEALETSVASLSISKAQDSVHSRQFRSYCDNTTSKQLITLAEKLLQDIFKFQARAYERNAIKARAHKRYVLGFKETLRQLAINKVKLIIMAPDCEPCHISGGPDEIIDNIKSECKEKGIPYVFALKRRKLGYVMFKKAAVSCISVLSYDGAQDTFRELLKCLEIERNNYIELTRVK